MFFAFLFALGYFQSVLTVAHYVSHWTHNDSLHHVEAPAMSALIISLCLGAYSWHKQRTISPLLIIALTLLGAASFFWISALRSNFYF